MNMEQVLKDVLKKISVDKKEFSELKKFANDFINLLNKNGISAKLGGSLAKRTLIKKGKQDIDIFAVFESEERIKKLGDVLKKIKLPGRLRRVHGSRDYFQIECGDKVIEIVPVLKVKNLDSAENITDVSLYHVSYVCSEIRKNPKLADEIILAKAFCHAQRCYGAESYIHGFSGYSLEVLVIYFGGFIEFLKGIQKKRVIDPMNYFKNEKEILRELNSSKLLSPVILVDPTYKYRNVCAGLGLETFERFLESSKKFLKNPSFDFFEEKDIDVDSLRNFAKENNHRFVELEFETDRQEGDIAGTKMKKFFDFFCRELERSQQVILRREFDYSGKGKKAKGYLVVKERKEIEVRGPKVSMEDAVKNFLKAKKGAFQKGGYYWVKKRTGIKNVFLDARKVEKEMGVRARIISII